MSQSNVVSIGGIDYDSTSGMPVTGAPAQEVTLPDLKRVQSVHAKGVHASQQRSKALNRKFVKRTPAKQLQTPPVVQPSVRRGGSMDVRRVARSPHITKFAPHPQAVVQKQVSNDAAPVTHPVVAKAHAVQHAKRPVAIAAKQTPTAQDIKHAAIGQALANAKTDHTQTKKSRGHGKAFNVAAASLGVLVIAGYFTYINMPNLSVRVAAAQAGIDAAYPEYRPVGYRLNGPVAYKDGEVSMNFASNSGPLAFELSQARSSWDSSALLEKYVNPRSSGKYATYTDAGLTIYTFGNDAAWVNGGILYTVDGTATLSNEQIRRIATSL